MFDAKANCCQLNSPWFLPLYNIVIRGESKILPRCDGIRNYAFNIIALLSSRLSFYFLIFENRKKKKKLMQDIVEVSEYLLRRRCFANLGKNRARPFRELNEITNSGTFFRACVTSFTKVSFTVSPRSRASKGSSTRLLDSHASVLQKWGMISLLIWKLCKKHRSLCYIGKLKRGFTKNISIHYPKISIWWYIKMNY